MLSFREFVLEGAQGPDNVEKKEKPDSEKLLEPRNAGERRFFNDFKNNPVVMDYPLKTDGQFKGRTSQTHLPHDGHDMGVGGEKNPPKQGSSSLKSDSGTTGKSKGRSYGEIRAVKQGSSTVKDSPRIREDVETFIERHEDKTPSELRAYARRDGLQPWQASVLRGMSFEAAE